MLVRLILRRRKKKRVLGPSATSGLVSKRVFELSSKIRAQTMIRSPANVVCA